MIKEGFPECPLSGGKNTLQKRFGTYDNVRCPEFRGGRFSEVANVLQVSGFQSVTRTLSTASRECVRFSECPLWEVRLYI